MAGRGADEGRRKLPGSGRGILPVRARKLRPRGQKSRDGAPIGAHPQPEGAKAARRGLIRMRRSALRPLAFGEGQEEGPAKRGEDYGVPGAAKNTGGEAWLFDNLIGKCASAAKNSTRNICR